MEIRAASCALDPREGAYSMDTHADAMSLTRTTARRINWDALADTIRLSLSQVGSTRGGAVTADEKVDAELIRRTFEVFKAEFQKAADTMQKVVRLSILIILVSLAVAFAGGVLLFTKPWAGWTLSATALGTLLGLVQRVRLLARDEVMLRVIPAKYEAVLQLSASRQQYTKILNDMLVETNSLRR